MENSNDSGKIIASLLVGAAIGGVLGILFAPDKGSVTRKKIMSKEGDFAKELELKFKDFIEGMKEEFEAAKEKAADFVANGKEK